MFLNSSDFLSGGLSIDEKISFYNGIRNAVPIIDACICKLVRLIGDFTVEANNPDVQKELNYFLKNVKVGPFTNGVYSFIHTYFEQLLTFGTAIGEVVFDSENNAVALYNADLSKVRLLKTSDPLKCNIGVVGSNGSLKIINRPDKVVVSTINSKPQSVYGVSILESLPFVTSILVKIYNTIGINWERLGNIRFSVNYIPPNDASEKGLTKERASMIASEWSKAMQSNRQGEVTDFVSVGDVKIKVIGSDSPILDSQVPVRQLLEQILSKLSIPPFMLGLSWSTTERMASQQVDMLTTEIEYYREILNSAIEKICRLWLCSNGYSSEITINWNDISLSDEVELANARLTRARAKQIEILNEKEQANGN